MNIQEQEDLDHEMGCFNNDFEAALAVSKGELNSRGESYQVADLVAAGFFVVTVSVPCFCRMTDAYVGNTSFVDSIHDTRAEAESRHRVRQSGFGDSDGVEVYVFPVVPAAPSVVEVEALVVPF